MNNACISYLNIRCNSWVPFIEIENLEKAYLRGMSTYDLYILG